MEEKLIEFKNNALQLKAIAEKSLNQLKKDQILARYCTNKEIEAFSWTIKQIDTVLEESKSKNNQP